ncbi:probable dolichyl pyrophosphate Glc1Man9GlcNAc2 alpha-1,3-glucosyltransferase [Actinidia eriantha]|uniref:probable dolichyl pyrophosphate Glc1Man9GlcNAc2 alpha-1,3-glucosyltransferase n=1 Tax=Actinidia eriantha TaxID=165200 RepID=UPI0025844722|nr:probable dolichyl pyrophosphate Glc1Man9GlcNAc2 alpha-1,3-glucosyltransferase [Actinidia eriantha]
MTAAKNPKTPISSPNPISDLAWFFLIATCVKLLLIPSYHSSDFEVHRHWLALTHSLSLPNWYLDETSPWTLDYPPFFAHFERFLSLFAKLVDPTIVDLHDGLNYKSPSVIIFQRLTVMVSDMVLIYGIYRLGRKLGSRERNLIWILVVWSPGLLIVDHMHFQYNGFLLGILLVSLSCLEEGRDLAGGFVFAVLLCFKHLFAVAGPVYFVYLLRHYCRGGWVRGFGRLVAMGTVVVAVFVAAYGPFVYYGQIQQVFHRMFPFGRGLCHAYWAPNFWVFYILLDKGLAFVVAKLGFTIQAPTASFTGGLVGDSSPFAVLPRVTPLITFVLVLVVLFPCLIKAWRNPQPSMITRWVAYAYTCGFLFGWHVHEKASLHFAIPLAIVATQSMEDARHYFILSIVSCYSLFPLLFEAQEYPIKVLLLLLHSILMWFGFSSQFSQITSAKTRATRQKKGDKSGLKESPGTVMQKQAFNIGWIGTSYLLGLLVVETWGRFLHPIILGNRLPFLPLLMISIYCALGMMYSWIWQLRRIISTR